MLLTNCGSKPAAPGPAAARGTVAATPAAWPRTLPDYAPPYPGSQVTTAYAGSSAGSAGHGLIVFTTADTPERIVDFYRDEVRRAGLDDVATMAAAGARMITANDHSHGRRLTVQASPDGSATSATLTYGDGG